jgi:hypothetical protein
MNSLDEILQHLTEQGELSSPFGEFLLNETKKSQDDNHITIESIEEKITKIENLLQKNPSNIEQNQRHLLIIDRFKQKFYKNKKN